MFGSGTVMHSCIY